MDAPGDEHFYDDSLDDHLAQLGIGYAKLSVPSHDSIQDGDNLHLQSEDFSERDDVSVMTFNQTLVDLFATEQQVTKSQSYKINKMTVHKIINLDMLSLSLFGSNFQHSTYNSPISIMQLLDTHMQQKRTKTDQIFMVCEHDYIN